MSEEPKDEPKVDLVLAAAEAGEAAAKRGEPIESGPRDPVVWAAWRFGYRYGARVFVRARRARVARARLRSCLQAQARAFDLARWK